MTAILTAVKRLLTRALLLWSFGVAVIATGLAWTGELASPALMTALNYAAYDRWVATRQPVPTTNAVTIFYQDAPGPVPSAPLDRAALARMVRALNGAGARVIGLLARFDGPSPPEAGGAGSDAMLLESIESSGKVVVPGLWRAAPTDAAADSARGARQRADKRLGRLETVDQRIARAVRQTAHLVLTPDADGVIRRVVPVLSKDDRLIPAFGLAVAGAAPTRVAEIKARTLEGFSLVTSSHADSGVLASLIPGDVGDAVLVQPLPGEVVQGFFSVPLERLREAAETRDDAAIRQWVNGKIAVLLPPEPLSRHHTPAGLRTPAAAVHLGLLNAVLTGNWLREVSIPTMVIITLLLSGAAAWALFAAPGWKGLLTALVMAAAYAGVAVGALPAGHLVLPLATPLLALTLASGAALSWTYVHASPRIRELQLERSRVQAELAAARDALATEECSVESLEEDLEEAKAALSESADRERELIRTAQVLQARCETAHEQEVAARRRVGELQARLSDLQSVPALSDGRRPGGQEQLHQECERLGITTQSPRVLALVADIRKVARSVLPVLIQGEPGTGKELFARAVHQFSPRASRPFVAVNMAAISAELFESELFGHVKGSFTGAVADRKGYFEIAHKGSIFLDEIGDLPYELQGKLLRVLQEKTFYRVGATEPTKVDVRVVAATNKNLQREVTAGQFREDLYFRLQGHLLRLPPLRERREDIPLLARHFLKEATQEAGRVGLGLSREALTLLESRVWRGNIRELQQCLRQAVALAEGKVITKEDLRLEARPEGEGIVAPASREPMVDPSGDQAVLTCLQEYEFDMQTTARALGWDRSTVTQRLKGLGFRALVDSRGDFAKAALALAGEPALARRVESKLREYYQHLLRTIEPCEQLAAAIAVARKRFKNLPDRHFKAVQLLIQQYFERSTRHHHAGHR